MSRVNKTIYVGEHAELNRLLSQLGIAISQDGYVSKEEVQKSSVPFEFFEAFAKLTKVDEKPWGTTAARLLKPRESEPRKVDTDTAYFLLTDKGSGIKPNSKLDIDERRALVTALRVLDSKEKIRMASLEDISAPLQNPDLVKKRASDLAKDPCWLTEGAMRLALFGHINGDQEHYFYPLASLFYARTTPAHEFECTYIPSMAPLVSGVSFKPDKMPASIQKAAASTVSFESNDGKGSGSGFATLYPGYILTARHLFDNDVEGDNGKLFWKDGEDIKRVDGKKLWPVNVKTLTGKTLKVAAEVLEVSQDAKGHDPDLAVLYVSSLPVDLKPLDFSRRLEGEERELFLIGTPLQKEPNDLLVTVGKMDAAYDSDSLMDTTSIGLPGNSGGPLVNIQGEVEGIEVQMVLDPDPPLSSRLQTKVGEPLLGEKWNVGIKGSRVYPINVWGQYIIDAINKHRQKQ